MAHNDVADADTASAQRDPRLQGTEIADSVLDLIGHTPLVRLKRVSEIEKLPSILAMHLGELEAFR